MLARQWKWVADMNADGIVTISDVWLWIEWLFYWPGDGFIYILIHKFSTFAQFFELTSADYGEWVETMY